MDDKVCLNLHAEIGLKIELYAKNILGLNTCFNTIFSADFVEATSFVETMIVLLNANNKYTYNSCCQEFIANIKNYIGISIHDFEINQLMAIFTKFTELIKE